MDSSFGIYLGNCSACLSLNKDGKTEIIANDSGDRVTPAVVAINGNEFITGLAAKQSLIRNTTSSVTNNKRLMNNDITNAELEEIKATSNGKISEHKITDLQYSLVHSDRNVITTPNEVSILLFKLLFNIASSTVRCDKNLRAVLAVPYHFSQSSRKRLMICAEEAGFNILQVISEPSAALLAYGLGEENTAEDSTVLVYRLGGTSCDVTVLKVSAGMYSVQNAVHRADLGGNEFTELLADYIASEFMNKWKLNPQESRRSMNKLRDNAEKCKHVLSTLSSSHIFVESLCEGVDWSQNITRPRFENLISPVLSKYLEPIKQCIENIPSKINKVILCGASLKIPKLQAVIASMFPEAQVLNERPDEIIAEGCAKQAAYLAQAWDRDCEYLNMPVKALSKTITIKDQKGSVKVTLPALTALPTKISFTECSSDSDDKLKYTILENEADTEKVLGEVTLPVPDGFPVDIESVVMQNEVMFEVLATS